MPLNFEHTITVQSQHHGLRIDVALSQLLPDFSRSKLSQWIREGSITVNGKKIKPKEKLSLGDTISVAVEHHKDGPWQAQPIDLNVVYSDDDVIVINKPASLVVHPAPGNRDHTLVNALLYHYPELSKLPRAGLIHRLDKDTTGLLVVAKNLAAHHRLVKDMQERNISRQYRAIAHGQIHQACIIDAPIARHPQIRTKMAVVAKGKPARTHCTPLETYPHHCYVHLQLDTGRTHQIRVHMKHIGHPLVGDKTYGKSQKNHTDAFDRQALHAYQLSFNQPRTEKRLAFLAPLPDDMETLLQQLRSHE